MRLLITGVTGFVGRNLIPLLIERFPSIRILSLNRNIEKAVTLFPYPQIKHVGSEDFEALKQFNPHLVFHLATLSTPRDDSEIIPELIGTNITYGVKLLSELRNCSNLRLFVNTGTFSEYRFGGEIINDAYLYAVTKSAFRTFLEYFSDLSGYNYINIIPYTIYGGEPTIKRLMDYLIESLDARTPIDMSEGKQVLDFLHIKDLCEFYLYIIQNEKEFCKIKRGEIFHIGTGIGTSIRKVSQIIEKVYHRKCNINWGGLPYRRRDIMRAIAPIFRNKKEITWEAKITLYEGIKMMKENIV